MSARFLETVILIEGFCENLKRKLSSSLCYHMTSVHTCFCALIYLIFRFVYLACSCFSAMLFSVFHLSIVNFFYCLYYMPHVDLYLLCFVYAVVVVFCFPKSQYLLLWGQDIAVVEEYCRSIVPLAAITYLHSISVKGFVYVIIRWKIIGK